MKAEKLYKLEYKLNEYFRHVNTMMEISIQAIKDRNTDSLNEIINLYEPRANHLELRIDQLCQIYIAKFEPKALALRKAVTTFKINSSLERIADHLTNVARIGIDLTENSFVNYMNSNLLNIFYTAHSMYKDTMLAVATDNIGLATDVIKRDKEVNHYRDQILRSAIQEMTNDSLKVQALSQTMEMSRNIERIADLATNICEDLIYRINGIVLRHQAIEDENEDNE